ncbi:MAG: PfkB family carbohydrate kinase [Pirellulaceae bacterium]|jgi:bifunctional ADP-heptose synthase (sugar kinase/adenylyltransferase)|nr:PfkB family carbohydrate kinase [Pirellulaceae bacterium]
MARVALTVARLEELIARFAAARVAVLGDFFLDKYLDVDPTIVEASVETGKPAHQVVGIHCSPGAAGTIVCNLAALGTRQLHAIGFAGDDGEGFDLRKELTRLGCTTTHLYVAPDRRTPTYLKPRDTHVRGLAAEHSRYDTKNRGATSSELEQQIVSSLDQLLPELDAVIVLDQVEEPDCGVVTAGVRSALGDRAQRHPHVRFWADSRRRIRSFARVIIKPNQFEAVGRPDPRPGDRVALDELVAAARRLRELNQAPVVVTRGAEGMLVSDPDWTEVPAVQLDGELDPTGAGDSATAGSVLALCAGARLPEAALVGNLVASLTIVQLGTTGVARPDQLADRLRLWQGQQLARDRDD